MSLRPAALNYTVNTTSLLLIYYVLHGSKEFIALALIFCVQSQCEVFSSTQIPFQFPALYFQEGSDVRLTDGIGVLRGPSCPRQRIVAQKMLSFEPLKRFAADKIGKTQQSILDL